MEPQPLVPTNPPPPILNLETGLDLASIPTDALRSLLVRELADFAKHLLRLAAIWVELERRGEDMTSLRGGIGKYLPAIAAGTVLADTVVRFSGHSTLLRHVSSLTPEQQRKVLDDGSIDVAERKNGHHDLRRIPVTALTSAQIRLAFAERSIRTEAEQVAILYSPAPAWKPRKAFKSGRVTVDRTQETVAIGRSQVSIQEMMEALKDAGIIP
jgi:hypothetical protein